MLYCAKCNKDVDFNSVAVQNTSSPRVAMTMMEEDQSPTIISGGSTTTNIVNVCKECGQDNLWQSKAVFETQRKQEIKESIATQAYNDEAFPLLGCGGAITVPLFLWGFIGLDESTGVIATSKAISLLIAAVGLLVIAIWWAVIIIRHGR